MLRAQLLGKGVGLGSGGGWTKDGAMRERGGQGTGL